MNRRGLQMINMIKQRSEGALEHVITSETNDNQPESPMQCQFTDEEWRYLNDIYNENDAVDGNIVHNDSDIVIFDSNECTPVPSPNSIQDFDCPISQTEQSCTKDVQEPCDIPSVNPTHDFDCPISPTEQSCNNDVQEPCDIPSINSLISASPSEPGTPNIYTVSRKRTLKQDPDHSKQWEYINKFTKKIEKKRQTKEGPSRRKFTTNYYLPVPNTDSNSFEPIKVCLKMFCATLAITDQFIRTAHEKLDISGVTGTDNRGKHLNHPKKIDTEMIRSVCDHVKSFQPVESHYTRKSSSKLYLDNNLSFAKMFALYKEWNQLHNYNNTAQTERQYRTIVNDNMNVAFYMPKKDLCDKCHAFDNIENPTEEEKESHAKHLSNKQTARKYKAEDKELATQNPSQIVCATYDFQKVLNCPSGEVSLFYYKRKLSLMHLTVFDAGKKEASCYMWPENIAKRGANKVASCLLDFIRLKVTDGAQDFRFWSDNCAGQNRNRVVYSLYMYASRKFNIDITHRFLESGHTQQEADSVHALVERSSKGKIIYTPDQWYALVRWAKTNSSPYKVTEVTKDMLFDFKTLLDNRNWKKNTENQDVRSTVARRDPNNLEKLVVVGQVNGKRLRGRSPTRWLNAVKNLTRLTVPRAIKIAEDRGVWRRVVHQVTRALD
ncbi:unnamed protein product [Spodoptera littoralis]|uniref:DUF7869 domain-containing protein n=1 Tax=Spodoptera littoralis TaxID=7109 RepID=A0A9P0MYT5_SPOLI|nr:unnamed protein product [Spodoptera littoralis]CAH1635343.1 unnamed protein product [Spodoptera littoralis]